VSTNTSKKPTNAVLDMTDKLVVPAENTKGAQPATVPYSQYEELRVSYTEKCKELDQAAKAYYGLQQKSAKDIATLKQFLKGLNLSVELLWPSKSKGEL
jgi:hypothetical protein